MAPRTRLTLLLVGTFVTVLQTVRCRETTKRRRGLPGGATAASSDVGLELLAGQQVLGGAFDAFLGVQVAALVGGLQRVDQCRTVLVL